MSGLPLNNNWAGYKYSNNGVTTTSSSYTTPQNAIPDKMLNFDMYPLTNYTFGTKDAVQEEVTDVEFDSEGNHKINPDFKVLRQEFEARGCRKRVEAVLVVHDHNLPHLLLLQQGNTYFKLPGGLLMDNETEQQGIRRHLKRILGKANVQRYGQEVDSSKRGIEEDEWLIKDSIGQWYRPKFSEHQYCYKPAHVTKPKEHTKLFLVQLPDRALFAVPRNYKLVAAPLHEFYGNNKNYGTIISAIPHMISRYNMHMR